MKKSKNREALEEDIFWWKKFTGDPLDSLEDILDERIEFDQKKIKETKSKFNDLFAGPKNESPDSDYSKALTIALKEIEKYRKELKETKKWLAELGNEKVSQNKDGRASALMLWFLVSSGEENALTEYNALSKIKNLKLNISPTTLYKAYVDLRKQSVRLYPFKKNNIKSANSAKDNFEKALELLKARFHWKI